MLDLRDYLCRNQVSFRNYAQDRRKGLRISSALAESAMSHLVNERMGKRQSMRWSAGLLRVPTSFYRFVVPYSTIDSRCSSASGCLSSDHRTVHHCDRPPL
jgi:hypothetical protein